MPKNQEQGKDLCHNLAFSLDLFKKTSLFFRRQML